MVAAHVLHQLSSLTAQQAEHWVAAALGEARALRAHDDNMYPADADDQAAVRAADHLHAAWRVWVDAAEALLDRIRPLQQSGQHVDGAHDLEYAAGRCRAMLQITPADHARAVTESRSGRLVPVEEIRRELRDRLQSSRPTGS